MEQKNALIFSLLITLLIASNIYLIKNLQTAEIRKVVVTRVIDGDTLEVEDNLTLRLININTPEKNSPGFEQAKEFLKQFENKTVQVEELGKDKYKRTLARVYTPSYLNLEIVKEGLATKFLVRESELDVFSEAEKSAIENEKGIWKKSKYFSCLASKIDAKKEEVLINNNCEVINIRDWWLRDESRKKYKFPSIELIEIKIHTAQGNDTRTDLFWNEKGEVWNDDRDSIYIFDSENNLVHYETYGY